MKAAAVVLFVLSSSVALAQPPAAVTVTLGPAVQARVYDLGRDELNDERSSLAKQVTEAIGRASKANASGPIAARLVIEDIQPNRPTSAQLGRSPGLNAESRGLGGVAITGAIMEADGSSRPVRFRFFPTLRAADLNFDTWGDTEQGFGEFASEIARGRSPDDLRPWPAPMKAQILTGTRIPG